MNQHEENPFSKPGSSPLTAGFEGKIRLLGGLAAAVGAVLALTETIPRISSLIVGEFAGTGMTFPLLLATNVFWMTNLLFIVGGVLLLLGKSGGHVVLMAACCCWLGMLGFHLLYFGVRHPFGIPRNAAYLLGLAVPVSVYSLSTLFVNIVSIWSLVPLNSTALRGAMRITSGMRLAGFMIGLGLVLYGISCKFLSEILTLPPVDFQF